MGWKERLKKINWWGLGGGLALGAAAVWANRSRKRSREAPRPIPEDIRRLDILTEQRRVAHRDRSYLSRAVYRCTPTRFRVWSVLGGEGASSGEKGKKGLPIFHVAPEVHIRAQDEAQREQVLAEEKFYATIHVYVEGRRDPVAGSIGRGRVVEFHKCHVGGSLNGVETGEKIVAMAPVADYEIESA